MSPGRCAAARALGAVGLLAAALGFGCGQDAAPPKATGQGAPTAAPLPEGDGLPERVEEMVAGSTRQCRQDRDCAGKVCYFGTCLGILLVDQRWIQETIAAELAAAVAADPRLTERLVRRLSEVVAREQTDVAYRARAVRALEAVGAREAIAAALELPDERLQAAAALALVRLRDARGLAMTRALTEDDAVPIAAEALAALGVSGAPEQALVPLLRVLDPDLDRALVRAAVVALGQLEDPRAVRPLVRFLGDAPEYLRHRALASLRQLTGAKLGDDAEAWAAWVRDHAPPAPPAYQAREVAPDDSLGLPPP